MRRASLLAAALAALLATAASSDAQTATGQVTGTVTDASASLIAGARVKITNTLTGLTRETITSDRGTYSVPLLPVGTYLVTAEKEGFKVALSS